MEGWDQGKKDRIVWSVRKCQSVIVFLLSLADALRSARLSDTPTANHKPPRHGPRTAATLSLTYAEPE